MAVMREESSVEIVPVGQVTVACPGLITSSMKELLKEVVPLVVIFWA